MNKTRKSFLFKINELKQVKDIFSGNQWKNLIKTILKEAIELQNSIKFNDLNYSLTKANIILATVYY